MVWLQSASYYLLRESEFSAKPHIVLTSTAVWYSPDRPMHGLQLLTVLTDKTTGRLKAPPSCQTRFCTCSSVSRSFSGPSIYGGCQMSTVLWTTGILCFTRVVLPKSVSPLNTLAYRQLTAYLKHLFQQCSHAFKTFLHALVVPNICKLSHTVIPVDLVFVSWHKYFQDTA